MFILIPILFLVILLSLNYCQNIRLGGGGDDDDKDCEKRLEECEDNLVKASEFGRTLLGKNRELSEENRKLRSGEILTSDNVDQQSLLVELRDNKTALRELKAENIKLKTTNTKLSEEIQPKDEEIGALNRRIQEQRIAKSDAIRHISSLTEKNAKLEEKNRSLLQEKRDIEERYINDMNIVGEETNDYIKYCKKLENMLK